MTQSESKPEQLPIAPVLRPILLSTLILVSGIVIGSGLTLIVTSNSDNPKSLPPAPEYMSARMLERIVRELKLSPEQHEQIQPIVQQRTEAMELIREIARPQISSEIKLMNEEIIAILDEGQKQLWKKTSKEMQERFTRMGQRRGQGDSRRGGRDSDPERRGDEGQGEGRREGRDSDPERQRDEQRQGDRSRGEPPEGQLPRDRKPPIDDIVSSPQEAPPTDNTN